jgi:hypothetical protein
LTSFAPFFFPFLDEFIFKEFFGKFNAMSSRSGLIFFVLMIFGSSPARFNTLAWVTGPSKQKNHMVRTSSYKVPSSLFAPHINKNTGGSFLHSSVMSPQKSDKGADHIDEEDDSDDDDYDYVMKNYEEDHRVQQQNLSLLCNLFEFEPKNLLRFETTDSGVRGIYLNRFVKSDEIIMKIPLNFCLSDNQSPSWLSKEVKNDPNRSTSRLAARWIEMHMQMQMKNIIPSTTTTNDKQQSREEECYHVWSSLIPDPEFLKASLPVHWPEATVENARSTALELAADSAFFERAEAVDDLINGLQRSPYIDLFSKDGGMNMKRLAHHALDLVQTRSCHLEDTQRESVDVVEYRRVLAPIFDFINHGSRNTDSSNACFALEHETEPNSNERYLVVRSLNDIDQNQEVKIDYGTNARPEWRCLLSYGFVPEYNQKRIMVDYDEDEDDEEGENLAEVYMKGKRYEVTDDTVPVEMVADATAFQRVEPLSDDDEANNDNEESLEIVLTAEIALRISERISDAAYYLLLEPEQILDIHDDNDKDQPTTFEIISKKLAASLRWSQHRTLLACADGLRRYAKESKEESSYQ